MEDEIEWHVEGADVPTWAIVTWVGAVLVVLGMVTFLTFFLDEHPIPAGKATDGSVQVPEQASEAGSQPR